MTAYRIGGIRPNPFRSIDRYPIDRAKVEALKGSIERTDFWDNLVARIVDGEPEVAYGHHRMVALRELFPPDHEIGLIVRDLDDASMLHIMADENLTEWGHNSAVAVETVRAVRDFLNTSAPPPKYSGPGQPPKADNGAAITAFLGWPEHRVKDALSIILAEEKGTLRPEDTADLPLETATVMRRTIEATAASVPEPKREEFRRESVKAVREHKAKGGGKRDIATTVQTVKERVAPLKAKEDVPIIASEVVRGVANTIAAVAKKIEALNALLVAHPEAAQFVRDCRGREGQREYLATTIMRITPPLDALREVVVNGKEPVSPALGIDSGIAPATAKVVS